MVRDAHYIGILGTLGILECKFNVQQELSRVPTRIPVGTLGILELSRCVIKNPKSPKNPGKSPGRDS